MERVERLRRIMDSMRNAPVTSRFSTDAEEAASLRKTYEALRDAQVDDEPLSDQDNADMEEAVEQAERGETCAHEELTKMLSESRDIGELTQLINRMEVNALDMLSFIASEEKTFRGLDSYHPNCWPKAWAMLEALEHLKLVTKTLSIGFFHGYRWEVTPLGRLVLNLDTGAKKLLSWAYDLRRHQRREERVGSKGHSPIAYQNAKDLVSLLEELTR